MVVTIMVLDLPILIVTGRCLVTINADDKMNEKYLIPFIVFVFVFTEYRWLGNREMHSNTASASPSLAGCSAYYKSS